MNIMEHKAKHIRLLTEFDELLADFMYHYGVDNISLNKVSVADFLKWAVEQTKNPSNTEGKK